MAAKKTIRIRPTTFKTRSPESSGQSDRCHNATIDIARVALTVKNHRQAKYMPEKARRLGECSLVSNLASCVCCIHARITARDSRNTQADGQRNQPLLVILDQHRIHKRLAESRNGNARQHQ